MAGDNKPAPIADDTIDQIVAWVESAEIMAQSLGCSCSHAMRIMLKSMQVIVKTQNASDNRSLLQMITGKVQ